MIEGQLLRGVGEVVLLGGQPERGGILAFAPFAEGNLPARQFTVFIKVLLKIPVFQRGRPLLRLHQRGTFGHGLRRILLPLPRFPAGAGRAPSGCPAHAAKQPIRIAAASIQQAACFALLFFILSSSLSLTIFELRFRIPAPFPGALRSPASAPFRQRPLQGHIFLS